jgi:hypothetical protein
MPAREQPRENIRETRRSLPGKHQETQSANVLFWLHQRIVQQLQTANDGVSIPGTYADGIQVSPEGQCGIDMEAATDPGREGDLQLSFVRKWHNLWAKTTIRLDAYIAVSDHLAGSAYVTILTEPLNAGTFDRKSARF